MLIRGAPNVSTASLQTQRHYVVNGSIMYEPKPSWVHLASQSESYFAHTYISCAFAARLTGLYNTCGVLLIGKPLFLLVFSLFLVIRIRLNLSAFKLHAVIVFECNLFVCASVKNLLKLYLHF